MITDEEFDTTLRQWLTRKQFVPFVVETEDGREILIREPVLAFGGGSAGFIDPDDGALVGFSSEDVKAIRAAGKGSRT
jgi:hypothetical protein